MVLFVLLTKVEQPKCGIPSSDQAEPLLLCCVTIGYVAMMLTSKNYINNKKNYKCQITVNMFTSTMCMYNILMVICDCLQYMVIDVSE